MTVVKTDLPCFNVDETPYLGDVQSAVNACNRAGGGIVYVPGRAPGSAPRPSHIIIPGAGDPDGTGWFRDMPIWLVGDGPEFTAFRAYENYDALEIHSSFCTIEGISIDAYAPAPYVSAGIVIGSRQATITQPITGTRIVRCVVRSGATASVHLTGGPGNTNPELVTDTAMIQTRLRFCPTAAGSLILAEYSRRIRFDHCYLDDFNGYGIRLLHCEGVTLDNCTIDNDEPLTPDGQPLWSTDKPFLSAESCSNVFVNHCWFEEHLVAEDYDYFIRLGDYCYGWSINSCIFTRAVHTEPRAMRINDSAEAATANKGIVVVNPVLDLAAGAPTGGNDIYRHNPFADCTVVGGAVVGPVLTDMYDIRVGPHEPSGISANVQNVLVGAAGRNRVPRVNLTTLSGLANPQAGDIVFDREASVLRVRGTDGVWRYVDLTAPA